MRSPFHAYSKYPIPNKRMQFKEIQICLNITSSISIIVTNQKTALTMQYVFLITCTLLLSGFQEHIPSCLTYDELFCGMVGYDKALVLFPATAISRGSHHWKTQDGADRV